MNSSKLLTYQNQLEFTKAWRKAHKSHDIYFDYIQGVDARTSRDIPGLVSNGSLTYSQAAKLACKHFKIPL